MAAALTGDVGAGKSTVARVWRAMGIDVADSDAIARAMWSDPEIERAARRRWGEGIYDEAGQPVFRAIADKVFRDERERAFANDMLHPRVYARLAGMAQASCGLFVAEIPLLFEAGVPEWVDCVIYASAPLDARAARNTSRNWDMSEIERREKNLMSSEKKRAMSDELLFNSGTIEEWEDKARELGRRLVRMAGVTEITVWYPDESRALTASSMLTDRRLAASVDISCVMSRYRWHGETNEHSEWKMTVRSTAEARREIYRAIRETHPYELPAIISTGLLHPDYRTVSWIERECL